MSFSTRTFVVPSIMVVALLLLVKIYWSGLDGAFVLDDASNINVAQVGESSFDALWFVATHNTSGLLGRGVSSVSFALTGLMHGADNPWGFKYHNLLLHLINALLIFWLLLKLLPRIESRLNDNQVLLTSALLSFAWAVHPLQVSTVLYAVQRMVELSALFTLLTLLVYVKLREQANDNVVKYGVTAFIFFPLLLILALLSKETGLLIVFYVLAIEFFAFHFKFNSRKEKKRIVFFLSVFCIVPIILGSVYLLTHLSSFSNYDIRQFNLAERLLTQLHVVAFYISQIFAPSLSSMGLFLDDFPVTRQFDLETGLLLLSLLTILVVIVLLRKSYPLVSFGLIWFIVSHLLESTVLSLEMVFEHRNYLALLGLLLPIVAYAIIKLKEKNGTLSIMVLLVIFSTMTTIRASTWGNEELFLRVAVEDHPGSLRANVILANYLNNNGEALEARTYLENAANIQLFEAGTLLHLSLLNCLNNIESDSYLNEARERLSNYALTPYALNIIDVSVLQVIEGNCTLVTSEQYKGLIETALSNEKTTSNLRFKAYLNRLKGILTLYQGDVENAEIYFLQAFEDSGLATNLVTLINMLLDRNLLDQAQDALTFLEGVNAERNGEENLPVTFLNNRMAILRERLNDDSIVDEDL